MKLTAECSKPPRVLAFCAAVGILAGCAGDAPTPMWKGSTSVVDAIEVVSNPDAPLLSHDDIDVVELWRVRPGISDTLWTDPTRLLATVQKQRRYRQSALRMRSDRNDP